MSLTAQWITTFFDQCRRRVTGTPSTHYRSNQAAQGRRLTAIERHRSRQALRHLDARLLRDIGLTEAEAIKEQRKPIWK